MTWFLIAQAAIPVGIITGNKFMKIVLVTMGSDNTLVCKREYSFIIHIQPEE